jgi:MerR family transcriptional regulator, light-induced transcriptional regulator
MTDQFQEFSIKDLESYTGVKAHTIRIWEQRYGLLKPDRTETNIRKYSDKELKMLLNISLLNQRGHKISEIATMDEQTMLQLIEQYSKSPENDDTLIATLKIAMLNFDEKLFNSIIDLRIASNGLEQTYISVLAPFMNQVGTFWLTNAICPAQEHFISNLVKQKIYSHTDKLGTDLVTKHHKTFVLYLPELEFHELSLLMLNFALRSRGFKTIYLGQSVPLDDLIQVYQRAGTVHFLSLFTTQPANVLVPSYLKKLVEKFVDTNCEFHLTGGVLHGMKSPELGLVNIYKDLNALLAEVIA